jgi:hypothetical protein
MQIALILEHQKSVNLHTLTRLATVFVRYRWSRGRKKEEWGEPATLVSTRYGVYRLTDFWYSSMRADDKHPTVRT